jgi:hypothetical protein
LLYVDTGPAVQRKNRTSDPEHAALTKQRHVKPVASNERDHGHTTIASVENSGHTDAESTADAKHAAAGVHTGTGETVHDSAANHAHGNA